MKRYQVFVSSTYKDLYQERNIVKKALLEKQCFPVGMEEFPAIDLNQFEYIKKMIDGCDYYVLILGGCVGTICEETKESYTFMEYQYALKKNIPMIVIIKRNKKGDCVCKESKKERIDYYNRFVEKATNGRICCFYKKKEELSGIIHFSLNETIEKYPRIGWIRNLECPINNNDNLLLRGRIEEYFIVRGEDIYKFQDEYYHFRVFENSDQSIAVKYGIATQGDYKLYIFYKDNVLNVFRLLCENEIIEIEARKIQISLAKMGNYDEYLLFISVGDGCIELTTFIYRFGTLGFKEIARIDGQEYMYVDYDLMVPFGSQGLFNSYIYCKNSIYAISEI